MNTPSTQQAQTTLMFPPGRLVQGDLYEPNKTNMKGELLTTKAGPNAGQPRVEYFFKVAIPKTQATWWTEAWGSQVLAAANAFWPQGQTSNPKFAWKIEDGDDAQPNFDRGNRKNCDTEGFSGCWVVKFSSGFATKVFDAQGNPMLQPGLVKRGFWIEVFATINSNSEATKPGIHINHNMVAFRAPDKEIVSGPDPRAVGFGRAALPAGVTAAPAGASTFPVVAPGVPVSASAPGVPVAGFTPTMPSAAPAAPAPVAVALHAGFIAPPVAGGVPVAAPPVPAAHPAAVPPPIAAVDPLGAPAGYRMANPAGARYEQFRQGGWIDAAMITAGHMVRL